MYCAKWCLMRPAVHMPEVAMMTAGPLRLLIALDCSTVRTVVSPGKPSRRVAGVQALARLRIEAFAVAAEDFGHFGRHRAVEEDRHAGDPPGVQKPAEEVDQFLGPLDGEDGNDRLAAAAERLADHLGQLVLDAAMVLVVAVAVGRFHDEEIGLREIGGRADQGLVALADVAAEQQPPLAAGVGGLQLDHRRAEDVAGVVKRGPQAVVDPLRTVVGHRLSAAAACAPRRAWRTAAPRSIFPGGLPCGAASS